MLGKKCGPITLKRIWSTSLHNNVVLVYVQSATWAYMVCALKWWINGGFFQKHS